MGLGEGEESRVHVWRGEKDEVTDAQGVVRQKGIQAREGER